jgi:hypothetical protein
MRRERTRKRKEVKEGFLLKTLAALEKWLKG